MSLLSKFIFATIVNIPLFSILCESFFSGKDANEALTISFGFSLFFIYIFQSLMIILLVGKQIKLKQAYPLLFALLFLLVVGIFNSTSVFYSFIVFLQFVNVILFAIWLAKESVQSIKCIIVYSYFASLTGFVSFAVLNFFIASGDFLFTLAQIQLPAYFLLFLYAYQILSVDGNKTLLFYAPALSYLLILLLGASRATDLNQFRFQFLPITLFSVTIILLLPRFLLKIILAFLAIIIIYHHDEISEILIYRLGSFDERATIFYLMVLDSFYFLVPQGLGASNQLFDINGVTSYIESTRNLYTPHSGFAAMLFDSSFVLFIFVFIFIYNISRGMNNNLKANEFVDYFVNTRIPFLMITSIIYFFENLFYLKFSITGATFSDDSLYPLIAIYFFYYKARKSAWVIKC